MLAFAQTTELILDYLVFSHPERSNRQLCWHMQSGATANIFYIGPRRARHQQFIFRPYRGFFSYINGLFMPSKHLSIGQLG